VSFVDDNLLQWVDDNELQWGLELGAELRQVWHDDYYIYAATSEGLDIIDIDSEQPFAYVTYSGGFTTVWGNDTSIYVGTSDAGIKYFGKSSISGSIYNPADLSVALTMYAEYPTITSNNVRYIHGQENLLMCCTASGVDTLGVYGKEAKTSTPYAQKCFLAPSERLYYTTASGSEHAINRVSGPYDWNTPDKTYLNDGTIFESGIEFNDIFVNGTIIYTATSNGVYSIDDDTDDFLIYFTGA